MSAGNMIRHLLTHPRARGLSLDSPKTSELRRQIIREKGFLRRIYLEWYADIARALPDLDGTVLEVGAGASFLDESIPGLISSDILNVRGISVVLDARFLPFETSTLRAIVMTNVFHHIPDVGAFLREASRCVRPGGRLVMIEPWITPWSRFVYRHLHHEPMDLSAGEWTFASTGPLSDANSALPWLVFSRDRELFEREFPSWRVRAIEPNMPFSYLLSGGLSLRAMAPGLSFGGWRWLERRFERVFPSCAMFARIVLDREGDRRTIS